MVSPLKTICTALIGGMMLLPLTALAQSDDFQTWSSIEIKKKVDKKLSFALEEELRLCNNSTTFGKNNVALSGTYALHKKLRLGAGYQYSYTNDFDDGYVRGHRLMLNATLRHKTESNFVLSLRERFQTDWSSAPYEYASLCLRHKLQVAYSDKDKAWSPFANVELTQALNNPVQNTIERIRAFAGCEYELTDALGASVAFGYQHTDRPLKKPKDAYLLSIGFSYSL